MNTTHEHARPGFGQALRALRRDAGLTQAQVGARVGYHASLISKLESAERVPSPALARRLDDLLAGGGLLARRSRETVRPPGAAPPDADDPAQAPLLPAMPPAAGRRRPPARVVISRWPTTLPQTGVVCPLHPAAHCDVPPPRHCLTVTGTITATAADPSPSPGDPDVVHALAGLLAGLTDESEQGGASGTAEQVLATVETVVHGLVRWCGQAQGGELRAPLHLASGYAQLGARLHMSLDHQALAMSWLQHGVRWADACQDTALRAAVYADMGTLVRIDHHGTSSLPYADALGALDPRRTWTAALAHTHRARALAPAGDVRAVDRELAAARRLLGRMTERDRLEAPWMVGEPGALRVLAAAGAALRDVAVVTGDPVTARRAVHACRRSLSAVPARLVPRRVLFTARLADSLVCTGDLDAAVTLMGSLMDAVLARVDTAGETAGETAGTTTHAVLRPEIRGLRRRLRPWLAARGVAELDDRLGTAFA